MIGIPSFNVITSHFDQSRYLIHSPWKDILVYLDTQCVGSNFDLSKCQEEMTPCFLWLALVVGEVGGRPYMTSDDFCPFLTPPPPSSDVLLVTL